MGTSLKCCGGKTRVNPKTKKNDGGAVLLASRNLIAPRASLRSTTGSTLLFYMAQCSESESRPKFLSALANLSCSKLHFLEVLNRAHTVHHDRLLYISELMGCAVDQRRLCFHAWPEVGAWLGRFWHFREAKSAMLCGKLATQRNGLLEQAPAPTWTCATYVHTNGGSLKWK